jgi:uncharacterized protein (TIGR02246 family)
VADPLTAEDRVAIMDLIADIPFRLDIRDLEGYVNNFTPDGVLGGDTGRREGREAIAAHMAGIFARDGSVPRPLRHILGIPLITGDRSRAIAQTQLMIPQRFEDGRLTIPRVGLYTDEVVIHEGRWRIRHRNVSMDLVGAELR